MPQDDTVIRIVVEGEGGTERDPMRRAGAVERDEGKRDSIFSDFLKFLDKFRDTMGGLFGQFFDGILRTLREAKGLFPGQTIPTARAAPEAPTARAVPAVQIPTAAVPPPQQAATPSAGATPAVPQTVHVHAPVMFQLHGPAMIQTRGGLMIGGGGGGSIGPPGAIPAAAGGGPWRPSVTVTGATVNRPPAGVAGGPPVAPVAGPGMGAQLAAGLPIAGAVVAGVMAIKRFMDDTLKAAESAGKLAASLLNADERLSASLHNLSETTRGISPVLGAFGSVLATFTTNLEGLADRYAAFNPDIAMAQGVADIRQQLGDLRRGSEAQANLVSYIQQSSQIQQKFEDMKIRLLNRMMPAIQGMLSLMEKILPFVELAAQGATYISPLLSLIAGQQREQVDEAEELRQFMTRPEAQQLPTNIIQTGFPFVTGGEGGVQNP